LKLSLKAKIPYLLANLFALQVSNKALANKQRDEQ
jgi:hypothetical protein